MFGGPYYTIVNETCNSSLVSTKIFKTASQRKSFNCKNTFNKENVIIIYSSLVHVSAIMSADSDWISQSSPCQRMIQYNN